MTDQTSPAKEAPELTEGKVEGALAKQLADRTFPQGNYRRAILEREAAKTIRAALARQQAEIAAYRKAYGCLACGENHPEGTICPPFEVRTTGMSWSRGRLSNAVARAERAESTLSALKQKVRLRYSDEELSVIFPEDCRRIQRVLAAAGFSVTLAEAERMWETYSAGFAAGWMSMRGYDDELLLTVLTTYD